MQAEIAPKNAGNPMIFFNHSWQLIPLLQRAKISTRKNAGYFRYISIIYFNFTASDHFLLLFHFFVNDLQDQNYNKN